MNYITDIKEQLDEGMHKICKDFILRKSPNHESPRYFNLGDFSMGELVRDKKIKIASTQFTKYFTVNVDYDILSMDIDAFWPQFREYRTAFLTEHYPSINTY